MPTIPSPPGGYTSGRQQDASINRARHRERLERVRKGRIKQKRIKVFKYSLFLSIKFIQKYWIWILLLFAFLQLLPNDNLNEVN